MHRFPDDHRALCAAPEHLALVDAAFTRPAGPAGQQLRDRLCRRCPVATLCLDEAMTSPEYGVWGGTTSNMRTRHGAQPADPWYRSRLA